MAKKQMLGIQHDKQKDTQAWYTDVITKGDLIEYTAVSGCYILKPKSQFVWDTIHEFMDKKIKAKGVKNASFPLFIPESLLMKEAEHVEGFSPEVAWVTHAGSSKLAERLAIRPTSETIMYDAYAKWVRSYNDLPLKLNQWCNIVRMEFKHPTPFLRSREFYWQEGHTVFATQAEAEAEAKDILLDVYKSVYEELLAVPVLPGRKSEKEKFAGAEFTLSVETFLPTGKAIQGGTTHYLGQNFAKAFGIKFVDKDQKKKYAHQNSWGLSTRSIGVMIMMHSDSHGLVLPPNVAENKVIIVPIIRKENKEKVLKFAKAVKKDLAEFNPILDDREQYSVGWKFNEAEMSGIPIRIEIGENEVSAKKLTVARRDTLTKEEVMVGKIKGHVEKLLVNIHDSLFKKAKKFLKDNIIEERKDLKKISEIVKSGKVVKTVFDGKKETDDIIKDKTSGKTLVIPFDSKIKKGEICPFTGEPAKFEIYIAKSL